MSILRGEATQAVFDKALVITRVVHIAFEGTDEVTRISIDEAQVLFDQNPDAQLAYRPDGVYVFIVPNPDGYTRVEIDDGH
jgi:hypothetical protein